MNAATKRILVLSAGSVTIFAAGFATALALAAVGTSFLRKGKPHPPGQVFKTTPISKGKADTMINNFQEKRPWGSDIPNSFLISASELDSIIKLRPDFLHVFMARHERDRSSNITVVIGAVKIDPADNMAKHIYFNVNGRPHLLEYVTPCPTCVEEGYNNNEPVPGNLDL